MAEVGSSGSPHGPAELLSFESLVTQPTVPIVWRCLVKIRSKSEVFVSGNLLAGHRSHFRLLPALAHGPLNAGATGYGIILAAFGGGALLGTILVGQVGRLQRPVVVGSLAYLVEALCIGVAPYLGSVAGVSAAMVGLGVANGFANVLTITAFQRWAPPGALGRLTGLLMLTSFGIFPLSVAIAAIFVRDLGPAPFFLFAAATLAAAILAGLTQRAWRDFGAPAPASDPGAEHPAPLPQPEPEKASNLHH